nr:hypothetical protein [Pedobacter sp. ASV2]
METNTLAMIVITNRRQGLAKVQSLPDVGNLNCGVIMGCILNHIRNIRTLKALALCELKQRALKYYNYESWLAKQPKPLTNPNHCFLLSFQSAWSIIREARSKLTHCLKQKNCEPTTLLLWLPKEEKAPAAADKRIV